MGRPPGVGVSFHLKSDTASPLDLPRGAESDPYHPNGGNTPQRPERAPRSDRSVPEGDYTYPGVKVAPTPLLGAPGGITAPAPLCMWSAHGEHGRVHAVQRECVHTLWTGVWMSVCSVCSERAPPVWLTCSQPGTTPWTWPHTPPHPPVTLTPACSYHLRGRRPHSLCEPSDPRGGLVTPPPTVRSIGGDGAARTHPLVTFTRVGTCPRTTARTARTHLRTDDSSREILQCLIPRMPS